MTAIVAPQGDLNPEGPWGSVMPPWGRGRTTSPRYRRVGEARKKSLLLFRLPLGETRAEESQWTPGTREDWRTEGPRHRTGRGRGLDPNPHLDRRAGQERSQWSIRVVVYCTR